MQSSWAVDSLQNFSSTVCSCKAGRSTFRADFTACFFILCMKSWGEQSSAGLFQVREQEEGLEEVTHIFLLFLVIYARSWQLLGRSCSAEEQRAVIWPPNASTSLLRLRRQSCIFKMLPLFLWFQSNNKRIGVNMAWLGFCEKNFIFLLLPPFQTSSSAAVSDCSSSRI